MGVQNKSIVKTPAAPLIGLPWQHTSSSEPLPSCVRAPWQSKTHLDSAPLPSAAGSAEPSPSGGNHLREPCSPSFFQVCQTCSGFACNGRRNILAAGNDVSRLQVNIKRIVW